MPVRCIRLAGHISSSWSSQTALLTVLMMMMMRSTLVAAALQVPLALSLDVAPVVPGFLATQGPSTGATGKTCIVEPGPPGTDAAPAIIQAFAECGHNNNNNNDAAATAHAGSSQRGKVIFLNETYLVKTVMNTTGLSHVDVDLQGTLLWDNTDIDYWLNHSLPVGYQNQSSAWLFGGESVHWDGHGHGTLDGDGQVWYDFVNGTNNYPGRPHQITIWGTTNSVFEGIRFVQSQMW